MPATDPNEDQEGGLRRDVIAGATVGLIGVPQCLAYALVAGLPPEYGLVTAFVAGTTSALLSRSGHLVTGPTNATALLAFAVVAPLLDPGSNVATTATLAAVAAVGLLAGLFRVVVALAGMTRPLAAVSKATMAGFLLGIAVLIAVMQFDEAIGAPPTGAHGLIDQLAALTKAGSVEVLAFSMASFTALAVWLGPKLAPRFPVALASVVVLGALAAAFGWNVDAGLPLVGDGVSIAMGWPEVAWAFSEGTPWLTLIAPAAALALLGTLETLVVSEVGAEPLELRRAVAVQGASNIVGSFFGAFPSSASPSRSALMRQSGSRSRVGPLVGALVVLPILLFAAPLVAAIPVAVFAGVLFAVVIGMIQPGAIAEAWRASPLAKLRLGVALGAMLLLPLAWAVVVGLGFDAFTAMLRRALASKTPPPPDSGSDPSGK